MTHQEELAHAANAYHAAPESEKVEHAKRIEAVLDKMSFMDLARYILAGPRGKVFAARHSESLTAAEAIEAARHVSDAEAKTFFAKVQK